MTKDAEDAEAARIKAAEEAQAKAAEEEAARIKAVQEAQAKPAEEEAARIKAVQEVEEEEKRKVMGGCVCMFACG